MVWFNCQGKSPSSCNQFKKTYLRNAFIFCSPYSLNPPNTFPASCPRRNAIRSAPSFYHVLSYVNLIPLLVEFLCFPQCMSILGFKAILREPLFFFFPFFLPPLLQLACGFPGSLQGHGEGERSLEQWCASTRIITSSPKNRKGLDQWCLLISMPPMLPWCSFDAALASNAKMGRGARCQLSWVPAHPCVGRNVVSLAHCKCNHSIILDVTQFSCSPCVVHMRLLPCTLWVKPLSSLELPSKGFPVFYLLALSRGTNKKELSMGSPWNLWKTCIFGAGAAYSQGHLP